MPEETVQPPLIPLSEEELRSAAEKLAQRIADLEALKKVHAEERKTMKEAEDDLENEISSIASTIREHGR